jgi:hypothetical protein
MAETVMPRVGGDGEEGVLRGAGGGRWDGVEVVVAIATKHHASHLDILDRKTKSVKLYRTVMVASELTDRKQIMD